MTWTWVLVDQRNRDLDHLRDSDPADTRVLMVLSGSVLMEDSGHLGPDATGNARTART